MMLLLVCRVKTNLGSGYVGCGRSDVVEKWENKKYDSTRVNFKEILCITPADKVPFHKIKK
jgi:hypothetical protein